MTASIVRRGEVQARPPTPGSRRARLLLAILASLVLLAAIGVVEVGVLTAVSVVSSGTNRIGGTK